VSRWRWLFGGLLGMTLACHSERQFSVPTPTSSTRIVPLPSDLDLVGFVDLDAWESLLLDEPRAVVMAGLVALGSLPRSGTAHGLVREALGNTRRLWFACRPSRFGCDDLVLVLSGSFESFEPPRGNSDYVGPLDRGQGWFAYQGPAVRRDDLSAIYLGVPDRLVLVSHAEVDAVERIIEAGAAPSELLVTERRPLSLRARPAALAEALGARSRQAGLLMERARSFEASVSGGGPAELVLELRVGFEDAAQAELARRAIELFARLATETAPDQPVVGLELESATTEVVVRLRFLRALAGGVLPSDEGVHVGPGPEEGQ